MMIFNSFTVERLQFWRAMTERRGRRFFLPTNKTFEGICLGLAGKFLQKELRILCVFKIIL